MESGEREVRVQSARSDGPDQNVQNSRTEAATIRKPRGELFTL